MEAVNPIPCNLVNMGSTDEDLETKAGQHEYAGLANAIQQEHEMSFRDALRLYPAAIGWSGFVSLAHHVGL